MSRRALEVEVSTGSMNRLAGVSQAPAGTEVIHLGDHHDSLWPAPPNPHYHVNCESAIYVVKGRGRFLSGERSAERRRDRTWRLHLRASQLGTPAHQRQHVGADGADSS